MTLTHMTFWDSDLFQAWPENARDRRKLYLKLSLVHHPDKPTGSVDRFEALSFAYRRANHRYDPSVPFTE
jgi:hypothetical protein